MLLRLRQQIVLAHRACMIAGKPWVDALDMKGVAARKRAHHLLRAQQLKAHRALDRGRPTARLKRIRGQLRYNFRRSHARLRHDVALVQRQQSVEVPVGEIAIGEKRTLQQ